jgi:hypothetical protein
VFKWVCLLVAVAALAAFGWILNDMRLQVKGLAENADRQLLELKGLTGQADKVLNQSEQVTRQLDEQVPRILKQTEQVTGQLNGQLPKILSETEKATTTLNQQLPVLLSHTETAADSIAELSNSFKQYKGLMGVVHRDTQNKGLFSYASSILDLIEGQNAIVGLKQPGADPNLKQALPAKEWANASRKDAHFLSLGATSKADVLHGLARTNSGAPWHIRFGDQAPRLLADWVKETHPESKDVK